MHVGFIDNFSILLTNALYVLYQNDMLNTYVQCIFICNLQFYFVII